MAQFSENGYGLCHENLGDLRRQMIDHLCLLSKSARPHNESCRLLRTEENTVTVYWCSCVVLTENGVGGVESGLIHGGVADEALVVRERDAGRREAVALVVGDDLAAVVPPDGHAGVGRPQVDANHRTVDHLRRRHRSQQSQAWKVLALAHLGAFEIRRMSCIYIGIMMRMRSGDPCETS